MVDSSSVLNLAITYTGSVSFSTENVDALNDLFQTHWEYIQWFPTQFGAITLDADSIKLPDVGGLGKRCILHITISSIH